MPGRRLDVGAGRNLPIGANDESRTSGYVPMRSWPLRGSATQVSPEELVQEAKSAAAAVGISGDRPSDQGDDDEYLRRVRSVAEGLLASAANDSELLYAAIRLALTRDAAQGSARHLSAGTRALGLAAVWMIPPDTAALDAAVLAEGMTKGSSKKLMDRRVQAIANLTRWDPQALSQAVRLVPTGIVQLNDVPDGAAIARDILISAREVLEGAGRGQGSGEQFG